jgi:mannose/cellobiose epimerase-like protein (N-acyl-D-glucosamine 2-epimerase family)
MSRPAEAPPAPGGAAWITLPSHHRWLAAEADRLLDFASASVVPTGFGSLDGLGVVDRTAPTELWVTTRMTYLFALGALWGRPGSAALCRHGLAAIQGVFHDDAYGGWFTSVADGHPVDDTKNAYETAFVVLASAAALTAGESGARALLEEALGVIDRHFWSAADGLSADAANRDFSMVDPYRGGNVNMHLTEAYLAAADALDDDRYRQRALTIAGRLVDGHGRAHDWRLPEHYDTSWTPLPDHHRDQPRHPRQPYGVTPGHQLEWSRLLVSLDSALTEPPPWLLEAAVQLFDRGITDGWDAEHGGLVYTVDQSGRPLVRDRMHWVAAEAIGAAGTLARRLGGPSYEHWYRVVWDWADDHLIDRAHGGWHHEVAESGLPSFHTWDGKPDTYHPLQATLVGRLPVVSSFARGIADGLLKA